MSLVLDEHAAFLTREQAKHALKFRRDLTTPRNAICRNCSSKVYSAAVVGLDAFEVEIEVHAGWGPEGRISVVGLPDTAIKESRDRVLSALSNSAGLHCVSRSF